jgi:hypothetical protein
MVAETKEKNWPELPYKGLSFYGSQDAPLFSGRDNDVIKVASLLASDSTRILILHGTTGCGKSSFLRAGLIPYLEDAEIGFQFLKDSKDGELKALFIRSTDKPLVELSKSVFEFAQKDLTIITPKGDERSLRLAETISSYENAKFYETVGRNPELFINILREIGNRLTKTLVLIVDQGEEVMTLKPRRSGDEFRKEFFEFISRFSRTDFDIKLIISLRTDYYGRLDGELQRVDTKRNEAKSFLLDELTREQIISAIKRPTLKEKVHKEYCSPYHFYRFSYEDGLPGKIADDLLTKEYKGGILPILQIICDTLYQETKLNKTTNASWKITKKNYGSLRGMEDLIEANIDKSFEQLCKDKPFSLEESKIELEKWKDILCTLATIQVDNTVTTQVQTAKKLNEATQLARCKLDFEVTMEYLARDNIRILRKEDLVKLGTDENIICYSLGHDAIGIVLYRWQVKKKEKEEKKSKLGKQLVRAMGLGYMLMGFIGGVVSLLQKEFDKESLTIALLFAGGGLLIVISSFLLSEKYFGTVLDWTLGSQSSLMELLKILLPTKASELYVPNKQRDRKKNSRLVKNR